MKNKCVITKIDIEKYTLENFKKFMREIIHIMKSISLIL